jgi:cytochrome c peroxidase
MLRSRIVLNAMVLPVMCAISGTSPGAGLTPQQELGKSIFFDANLSINSNQACAACHAPEAGWTGPEAATNAAGSAYEGSIAGRFGNRKPPSSAYATLSPILHFVVEKHEDNALFIGGNFWDGRATGERLGSPAAEQAQGPFLNPLEQALPDMNSVVNRVCTASYPVTFETVYPGACDPAKVVDAYDDIAYAIAAFEASPESNAYTAKFDAYLAGKAVLSSKERLGLNLFNGKAGCVACHPLGKAKGKQDGPPLFTDFTFDNLGVPRNPANPFYAETAFNPAGYAWIDLGLGGFLESRQDYMAFAPDNYGKHKVPTLRNVDKRPSPAFVKAYGHNGYFKTLRQIVHFYNTRDTKPTCVDDPATSIDESLFTPVEQAIAWGCWPEPEVAINVNHSELGNLHLTDDQEDAIVEFLGTLSDGYSTP